MCTTANAIHIIAIVYALYAHSKRHMVIVMADIDSEETAAMPARTNTDDKVSKTDGTEESKENVPANFLEGKDLEADDPFGLKIGDTFLVKRLDNTWREWLT